MKDVEEMKTFQWCYNFKSPRCPMEMLPTKDDCENCDNWQPIWDGQKTGLRILLLYTDGGNVEGIRDMPHTDKRVLDEIWRQLTEVLSTVPGKDPETLEKIMDLIGDVLITITEWPQIEEPLDNIKKILEPHITKRWKWEGP